MKQSECDKQCRVIIGLMIFITFIGIFVGLVIGRMMGLSEKRNPSEEHQQVMSRLESVERACSDINMNCQVIERPIDCGPNECIGVFSGATEEVIHCK